MSIKKTPIAGRRKLNLKQNSLGDVIITEDLSIGNYDDYDHDFEDDESAEARHVESGFMQWSVGSNNKYIPCFRTVKKVPPGLYELKMNNELGFFIERQTLRSDDLLELPFKETKEILSDIKKFWEPKTEENFKKYSYIYKRGILLYGPPGNGKSYLIQNLCRHLIKEKSGIIFNLKDADAVELFLSYASVIVRSIEPLTSIMIILEDIDNLLENHRMISSLLNLLDGIKTISRAVYIATTNYPEKLEARISNRPSRFDRKYKIGTPNAEVREFYIRKKLNAEDLKKIDLKKWVKETSELSISHIKELIISVIIFEMPFEETIKVLKEMGSRVSSMHDNGKIGFHADDNDDDEPIAKIEEKKPYT